jgi:hypothetical protein
MAIYFKPAMKVTTTTWRDPETGKVSHFEHEVEIDPRSRPVLVDNLAELKQKLGSQDIVCETQQDGRTYVFARDLVWDGALGEYPPVLGQLQVIDVEEVLNRTLWQGDHS